MEKFMNRKRKGQLSKQLYSNEYKFSQKTKTITTQKKLVNKKQDKSFNFQHQVISSFRFVSLHSYRILNNTVRINRINMITTEESFSPLLVLFKEKPFGHNNLPSFIIVRLKSSLV